jgi:hypothetical protein
MRFVPNGMTRPVARVALKLQHQSPHLLFGAGVVGVVATAVLASKATLQLDSALTEIEETRTRIKESEGLTLASGHTYTAEDQKRDLIVHNTKSVISIGKLYAPTVIVGVISIGCLTGAHVVLNRRNVALTAAYAGLEKAYQGYRDRVREEYGEDTELALHHGTTQQEVTVETTNGPKKQVKTLIDGTRSPYAKFFDELNPNYQRQAEYNLVFIKCQQDYANNLLTARGHLFLNDVYDMLGIERTKAGSIVGWFLDGEGDSYVDFGLYDDRPSARNFVNGREAAILLDFNVDGVIYDKLKN